MIGGFGSHIVGSVWPLTAVIWARYWLAVR